MRLQKQQKTDQGLQNQNHKSHDHFDTYISWSRGRTWEQKHDQV